MPPGTQHDRTARFLAAAVAVLIGAWLVAILTVRPGRVAVIAPEAHAGVEAASALARLFAALVLALFPHDQPRLPWMAGGLAVLGLGGVVFGYIPPLLNRDSSANESMYASLLVWSGAGVLFLVGLLPAAPPPFSKGVVLTTLAIAAVLGLVILVGADRLPPLVHPRSLGGAVARGEAPLPGLTPWYWALSAPSVGLALAAALGAARRPRETASAMGGWLLVAMTVLAGAQVHNLFVPSAFTPVLTSANLLRFAFAVVVGAGGVLGLRRVAAERAGLLAAEQEQVRRLVQTAVITSDFVAMIAHELGSRLAAIRGLADMLASGTLGPEEQARALAGIRAETNVLSTLVADVQASASADRGEFSVRLGAVTVGVLLAAAAAHAETLPGGHPFTVAATNGMRERVMADPVRILQVLCNLLTNAAKYSPPGAPIELRVRSGESRVRVEVADRGYGIQPDDLPRLFRKFERGRDEHTRNVPGLGLGLYLSQRIVQAHGAELTVEAAPGGGSIFGFDLEVVR